MAYDSVRYHQARFNASFPNYSVKIKKWFDMKFRSEYLWESGAYFPTDERGVEFHLGANTRLTRFDKSGAISAKTRYDTGAWVGWKDDYEVTAEDPDFTVHANVANVFQSGRMPWAVGPWVPETREMIFHMVLVNARRERAATEDN